MTHRVSARRLVALAGAGAAPIMVLRLLSRAKYPRLPGTREDPADLSSYALDQPGIIVERVQGNYLSGFALTPQRRRRQGSVVVFGGADGGCDWQRASALANDGYRTLALFYFGQENQRPTPSAVPLEFFQEALTYLEESGVGRGPLTVVGSSKGAELAAVLPTYYPQIDNLVLFSPTSYVYQGLSFSRPRSSWTWGGTDLPYVSFRYASAGAGAQVAFAALSGSPIPLRELHKTAAARDPKAPQAAIDFSRPKGSVAAFVGERDAVVPAILAANRIAKARLHDAEAVNVTAYRDAGHVFAVPAPYANGLDLGGTPAANTAALLDSGAQAGRALARWHAAEG